MTNKEYKDQLREAKAESLDNKRQQELERERNRYKKKEVSTSKLALFATFAVCIEILIFSEVAMLVTGDISALYSLIAVPATLVPTLLSYYNKSKVENSQNGITYEMALRNMGPTTTEEVTEDDTESYG